MEKCLEYYDRSIDCLSEEDQDIRSKMAAELYAADPNDPFSAYAYWQSVAEQREDGAHDILEGAVNGLKRMLSDVSEDAEIDEDILSIYADMLSEIALIKYLGDEREKALEYAEDFMSVDDECGAIGRLVYHACLLENKDLDRVIRETDDDFCDTLPGAYCRAIALFEKEGPSEDASDALLEAVSKDTEAAFFIIEMYDADEALADDDDELDVERYFCIKLISDLWAETDERLSFIGSVVFAIAYLTGRAEDPEDVSALEHGYGQLGCLDEMSEARDSFRMRIAKGEDIETIDEEAIMLFREMREKGCF